MVGRDTPKALSQSEKVTSRMSPELVVRVRRHKVLTHIWRLQYKEWKIQRESGRKYNRKELKWKSK